MPCVGVGLGRRGGGPGAAAAVAAPEAEGSTGAVVEIGVGVRSSCVPSIGRGRNCTDAVGRTLHSLGIARADFVLAENADNSPYGIHSGSWCVVAAVGHASHPMLG